VTGQRYAYSFALWPAHGTTFSRGLQECLKLYPRIEMTFTESEFENFRHHLKLDGFELHEVERVPYHEPETIICL